MKNRTDGKINFGLFKNLNRNSIPVKRKKSPIFPSYAALENCKLQGEIAKKKAAKSEIELTYLFPCKNSRVKKYITRTVTEPKIADGNLTAKSVSPNINTERTVRYV